MDATPSISDRLSKRAATRRLWAARLLWLLLTLMSLIIFARGVPTFVESLHETYGANFGFSLQHNPAGELIVIPDAGGQAAQAGVMERDVLVAVKGAPVSAADATSLDELIPEGAAGTAVSLQIRTGERPLREISLVRGGQAGAWLNRNNVPIAAVVAVAFGGELLVTLGFVAVAAFIFWRRGQTPIVWLASLVLILVFAGAGSLPVQSLYSAELDWQVWLDVWFSLMVAALLLFLFLFPSGRFVPRWTVVLLPLSLVWIAAAWVWPDLYFWRLDAQPYLLILIVFLLAGVAAQLWRYRHLSSLQQRQQTKWVVWGISVALTAVFIQFAAGLLLPESPLLFDLLINPLTRLAQLIIPVTFAFAIFQYRLWQIDVIVNRTLVYGGLTVLITAVYIFLVGGVSGLALSEQSNMVAFGLATVVVLSVIRPLHQRLQAQANRLVPQPTHGLPETDKESWWPRLGDLPKTAVYRAIWLLTAVSVVGLIVAATPLRYQMLQADVYGFKAGLQSLGLSLTFFATYFTSLELILIIGSLGVAALIAWQRPNEWLAMLAAVSLTLFGLLPPLADGLVYGNPQWAMPLSTLRLLVYGLTMALICLFPNGRFMPRWTGWLFLSWLVICAFAFITNPLLMADMAMLPNTRTLADGVWLLLGAGWFTAGLVGQIVRYRHYATATEKQQMKWLLWGPTLLILSSVISTLLLIGIPALQNLPERRTLFTIVMGGFILLAGLTIPASIAFSILRYRLWDVDIWLNRTLIYGGLTALVTAVYVLLVGGVGSLAISEQSNLAAFLVATVMVLLGIRPLHHRLQKQVDRLLPPPPQATPAETNRRNIRSLLLQAAWAFNAVLAVILFGAGLTQQVQHGFWQMPPAEALTSVPLLASLPAGNNPLLQRGLYPFALFTSYIQATAFVGVGLFLFWRRSRELMGVLASAMLIAVGLGFTPTIVFLPLLAPAWHRLTTLFQAGLFGSVFLFLCLFPNGRFYPRWSRYAAAAWLGYTLLWLPFPQLNLHRATTVWPSLIFAAVVFLGIGFQIVRFRRSKAEEKQQTKWVIAGFAAANFGLFFVALFIGLQPIQSPVILGPAMLLLGMASSLIPLTISVALFRYRLWEIDIIINRTLVYGGLTGLITAVYVLLIGGMGALAVNQSGQIIGFVLATALVLVSIRPLRARWQTAVNRLISLPDPLLHTEPSAPSEPVSEITHSVKPLRGPMRWLAWVSLLLAIALTLVVLGIAALYTNLSLSQGIFFLITPAYVAVGTIILMRNPQNRIGRLCLLIGWLWLPLQVGFYNGAFIPILNQSTALIPYFIQLSQTGGQVVCLLIFVYLPLLFPDGQYQSAGWQRFGRGLALLIAVPIMLTLIKSGPIFDWANGEGALAVQNPFGIDWPWLTNLPVEPLVYAWGISTMLATFAAIASLLFRWRQSDPTSRQQIKWVVYFLSTLVALFILLELMLWLFGTSLRNTAVFPLIEFAYGSLGAIVWVGFPLIIGLAVLKYRLYDIDIIINRTMVYGGLSLGIVTIYVLVVGALGTLFQAQGNVFFALLATGLIAVLFQPVRERLQRTANRLMFGERDDPYAVLSKLGAQLQTTATPKAMLQSVVETIAATLKLPYVAIDLADEQGQLGGAATGRPVAETVNLPLRYQNERVGQLVVSPRSPGEAFTEREQRLLADMAAQTGAVAYSVRLTAALQRSREKLVLTREEERRRIRRDLHDGLGPTLASQTFAFDAILELMETNPAEAARLLRGLKAQNQETVAEIRRLVYELRPPALDELGLLGALQAHVGQLNGRSTLDIQIHATPNPLPPLSAAVEVAAYRIALEAITNVVRHAQAQRCTVTIQAMRNGRSRLQLTVSDDGIGLPSQPQPGVGLNAMRERAEELGGSFWVVNQDKGMRVTAVLPLSNQRGATQA